MHRKPRLNSAVSYAPAPDADCPGLRKGGGARFALAMGRIPILLSLLFRCGSLLLTGLHRADPGKSMRTGAPPPKKGDPCGPHRRRDGARLDSAPRGVAPVLIDPCGKARNRTYRSGADAPETGSMNWRNLLPFLRAFWRRPAGPMNWRNPIRVIGLLSWPVILVVTWALWQGLKRAALLSWVGLQTIRFFAGLPASMILFLVGSGASVWTFLYRPFPVLEADPLLDLVWSITLLDFMKR